MDKVNKGEQVSSQAVKSPVKSKRRKTNRHLSALMIFTGFFLGLVIGMVLVNYKSKQDIKLVQDELDRVIEEQSAINVTNVYVPERRISEGKVAMNSYNTQNFRIDNGFMAYFDENGNKISHLGVDLSYHNSKVNWEELAASGCEFVMLRLGYRGYTAGGLVEDEKYKEYVQAAKDAGLKLGVYFFTQSITVEEAIEEADFCLEILDGLELDYPIAYDTEYVNDEGARTNINEISRELRSQMCIAFCERIREGGYYPIVYASENWLRRDLDLKLLGDYDIWAPQYRDENDFLYDFTIWQYTEKGNIPGVEGIVDLDISMVDYSEFVPAIREAYITGGKVEKVKSTGNIEITISTEDDPIDQRGDIIGEDGAGDNTLDNQDTVDDANYQDMEDAKRVEEETRVININ